MGALETKSWLTSLEAREALRLAPLVTRSARYWEMRGWDVRLQHPHTPPPSLRAAGEGAQNLFTRKRRERECAGKGECESA